MKGVDVTKITQLTTKIVDSATCEACCKYYIAPKRATCGHFICHTCWFGRKVCLLCGATSERRLLKLDTPKQQATAHARELVEAFERLFDVNFNRSMMDTPEKQKEEDPTKNVKEWLTSSENHFSAPPFSETQQSTQDILPPVQLSTSKIQIHAQALGSESIQKVMHVSVPQDDWDKIEVVTDTEYVPHKDKENIIGPKDFEPFSFEDSEFSNEHPRRSNRKKVYKNQDSAATKKTNTVQGSNNSSLGTDKNFFDRAKQNWSNVKKMKKEFGKLNNQGKTKLNVSIETCKKNQNMASKQNITSSPTANGEPMMIDDDTPNITDKRTDKYTGQPNMEVNKSTLLENEKDVFSVIESDVNINPVSTKHVSEDPATDDDKITSKNYSQKSGRRAQNEIENKQEQNELVTDKDNVNVSVSQIRKEATINIPFIKMSTIQAPNISFQAPNIPFNQPQINSEEPHNSDDDIHISVRVKDVVTNITINNREKDVQLKVNADRVVQTSLRSSDTPEPYVQAVNTRSVSVQTDPENKGYETIKTITPLSTVAKQPPTVLDKSTSIKKNTASAATVTAPFVITESVEKELSNIMECEEEMEEITETEEVNDALKPSKSETPVKNNTESDKKDMGNDDSYNERAKTTEKDVPDDMNLDDIDIFNSGSVKEHNVQMLKNSSKTPSEILVPTLKSCKSRKQKNTYKRNRELDDIAETSSKRQKVQTPDKSIIKEVSVQEENNTLDSPDYDQLMGQVFANIDADIDEMQSQKLLCTAKKSTGKTITKVTQVLKKTQPNAQNEQLGKSQTVNKFAGEKYSENMFSTVGNILEKGNTHVPGPETQQNIANLLTPGMCYELAAPEEGTPLATEQDNQEIFVLCTPIEEDDSDKSVVEETPQKNVSIPKTRNDSGNSKAANYKKLQLVKPKVDEKKPATPVTKGKSLESQDNSIINLTDSVRESTSNKDRDATIKPIEYKQTLETPLTINRFVDEITYKSTPMAKKSLKFVKNDDKNADDEENMTLCPTEITLIAKTTQEKQFMQEAFENQSNSPARKPLIAKNVVEEANKKYCIAGSCLSSTELTNLKILCFKRKWTYVEKYRPDLTHLVVSVDEENRSQRSVKYMCALAAGKWIISYQWVEKCLETKTTVNEEQFEALDSAGEPGPRLSRLADNKIFDGFTFCCLPPFSVLDLNTLVSMLEAAGGRVVKQPQLVRANTNKPCVLLCEPEHTEEDKYMYLAMELGVVPVNYEWVLNCLGGYSLCSLYDLLLCPASLLPKEVQEWPPELMANDDTE